MRFEHIARDRWHNQQGLSHSTLLAQYGTPMGWFRRSCNISENRNSEGDMLSYAETIRAAAVFNQQPTATGLFAVPYSLYVKHPAKNWHMVIVSTDSATQWIELAYSVGAQAIWLRPDGPVFQYQPIEHQADTEETPRKRDPADQPLRPRGRHVQFDREAVIDAIRNSDLTIQQLADQFKISKETVYKINRSLNRKDNSGRPIRSRSAIVIDPDIERSVVADAITGRMTKPMLARKHNIGLDVVTKIIRQNRVTNLPRGFYAMILGQKKSP